MTTFGETFTTDQPMLKNLMSEIDSGQVQLPDFQRQWVWDDLHIRELISSITLSYPIGAVMMMETGGEGANFKPRPFEGVPIEDGRVQPKKLVLDGQQRLTSLYLALKSGRPVPTRTEKGKETERVYYLDLRAALDPQKDRLETILSLPPERQVRSDFGRQVDLDLSSREKEFENLHFPLGIVFEPSFYDWLAACRSSYDHDPEITRLLDSFQQRLWMPIQEYKIPVIQLLDSTPKEAVCQVFEKVNTGGVALTVFELVTATFAADGFQLRKDWDEQRQEGKASLPGLAEQKVLASFDATDFLTAITLLSSYRRSTSTDRPVSCKRRDVLNLTLNEYQAHGDEIHRGLLAAARLLAREKIFDALNLPYKTQLVPLSAICAALGTKFEREPVRDKILRWYWCGVFGELYGGANETRFARDLPQVLAWIDGGPEPSSVSDAGFSPTRLLTLRTRQSAAYKGVAAQLMQVGSRDFLSGDPIELTTYSDVTIDIHHIFPSAYCKRQDLDESRWNSVVNKAPLTARTNRKLGGNAPSRYLELIETDPAIALARERLDQILQSHLISPQLLRRDAFDAFLRDRAARLLDLIERAMGKKIAGRDADEVLDAFGGPLERKDGTA